MSKTLFKHSTSWSEQHNSFTWHQFNVIKVNFFFVCILNVDLCPCEEARSAGEAVEFAAQLAKKHPTFRLRRFDSHSEHFF